MKVHRKLLQSTYWSWRLSYRLASESRTRKRTYAHTQARRAKNKHKEWAGGRDGFCLSDQRVECLVAFMRQLEGRRLQNGGPWGETLGEQGKWGQRGQSSKENEVSHPCTGSQQQHTPVLSGTVWLSGSMGQNQKCTDTCLHSPDPLSPVLPLLNTTWTLQNTRHNKNKKGPIPR